MTVSTTTPTESYTYTGPGQYDFDFLTYDEEDIRVFHTDEEGLVTELGNPTDFTVTLLVGEPGGSITTVSPASGGSINIRRLLPLEQLTRWINNNALDMPILEKSFDKIVMMMQQVSVIVSDGAASPIWKGEWVTGVLYAENEMISAPNYNWYMCINGHTSGVFDDDLASGYWVLALDVSVIEGYAYAAQTSAEESEISNQSSAQSATESGVSAAESLASKVASGESEANSATNAQNSANCNQSAYDNAERAEAAAAEVPNASEGDVGQFIKVNATQDGWEFSEATGGLVDTVVGTTDEIDVNSSDPVNPKLSISSAFGGRITEIWTGSAGHGVTIDWENGGAGPDLSDFDTILIQGNVDTGGIDSKIHSLIPSTALIDSTQYQIGGRVKEGTSTNHTIIRVTGATETSLLVDCQQITWIGTIIGIYGIRYR